MLNMLDTSVGCLIVAVSIVLVGCYMRNEQLYKFQLNDWQIQSEVRVENAQRFERDELIAILIERTKRLHR